MECLRAGEGKAVIRIWMEPQERGRGEGKEEGRGERRIMAELLTTPWMAKEDFLYQCAGVGSSAAACRLTPRNHLGACEGQGGSNIMRDSVQAPVRLKQDCVSIHTQSGRTELAEWVSGLRRTKHFDRKSFRLETAKMVSEHEWIKTRNLKPVNDYKS